MEMVSIKVNGLSASAAKGSTVLEAVRSANIEIPTLCYLKEINEIGACRICVVEVQEKRGDALGPKRIVTSCVYPITEGMEIFTNTPKVLDSRKKTLQLILSTHEKKCLSCVRSGDCELQTLCKDLK
ncbi:MAG: 2Fe-2S iron-sulfur cluster-binding protein, partial [Oscillospiraceae bacterium]